MPKNLLIACGENVCPVVETGNVLNLDVFSDFSAGYNLSLYTNFMHSLLTVFYRLSGGINGGVSEFFHTIHSTNNNK